MQPELRLTDDGSHTLFSRHFNQHYHNPNGAVAESRHVFFETSGLYRALQTETAVSILEVGFGTGLNLLLLLDALATSENSIRIQYQTVEGYPITHEQAVSFNFGEFINNPKLAGETAGLFSGLEKGYNRFEMSHNVITTVFYGLFDNYRPDEFMPDFILHDAFSPEANPELWTGDTFQKLAGLSKTDTVLATYCAASKARGAMCWAGWHVARAPGALGKREMTLASLNPEKLEGLERVNENRLTRRYKEDDF